jgi:FkbM family methyltransferase
MLTRAAGRLLRKLGQAVAAVRSRSLRDLIGRTPGSWLYRRATLSWLSDSVLVRQLPRTYRLFAGYCALQRHEPVGAETLLRAIIAVHRSTAGNGGIMPLRFGESTVFLDLHDPRFLRVPTELTEQRRLLSHFLRPGDTFIDVGANHGVFSIVASTLVGRSGFVVSIEPQPRLAEILRRSLALGPSRFEVRAIACGERAQSIELYIPLATSGSAGVFRGHSAISRHRTVVVPMRRIDDVVDVSNLPGRTFIKLDIEGSELSFLHGAEQLIRSTTPALLIEINHASMTAARTSRASLAQRLSVLGYDRFVTPDELFRQRPMTEHAIEEGNIIALPRSIEHVFHD